MTNPNGQNPAQPTGKRQLRGVSAVSTDTYEEKRAPAKQDPAADGADEERGSVAQFPGEVVGEMKKVIWPTGRQMLNYTLIVFAFMIIMTLLVWGIDQAAAWLIRLILIP